jgi:CheY-like chemotaxis protein
VSRVLVVDDDPNVRDLIAFRLRKAGHRVLCAESGAEALDLVETRGAPDVAVLDVSMPEMSGLELLPTMRSRDGLADMPAIFLSGLVDHADVAAGRALDATYLTKPFSGVALVNAVAKATQQDEEVLTGGW